MNVMILGSGAREHAIAVALKRSRVVKQVFLAPGNALSSLDVTNVACNITDPDAVLALVRSTSTDFVVVGPEAPLLAGVVDKIEGFGVPVLGPRKDAALLEGSKAYSKRAMIEAGVPTATHHTFKDLSECLEHMRRHPAAYVVKADGLMAGKGVIVSDDVQGAMAAARELFSGGQKVVVIERRLRGKEASLIALCDGFDYRLFPIARDHKRLLTGDKGKNTGGMGAFTPVVLSQTEFDHRPVLSDDQLAQQAILPILKWQRRKGSPFRGFLFAGLMFDDGKPYVLEYNARLGDPETQVLLTALDGDVLPAFYAAAHGDFADTDWPTASLASVCVVLAAEGYPDAPQSGAVIRGIGAAKETGAQVFGAGVAREGDALVVSGGRVLSVVGHGATVSEARAHAYAACKHISFAGMQFRTDIAGS
jgi:phosphoribosylamine--glycine ligase